MTNAIIRSVATMRATDSEAARRAIRRSPAGRLSQPASTTPVRPLSASERLDMADRESAEHEARLHLAFLAHSGMDGNVHGGGLS